ncbi:hypothetical protein LI095_10670, partial [Veillonella atypica]|uniref:hypothetical protein n=1 Tax=Veillonella atypica TaxID=39777 RepID=UPI001D08A641
PIFVYPLFSPPNKRLAASPILSPHPGRTAVVFAGFRAIRTAWALSNAKISPIVFPSKQMADGFYIFVPAP